MKKRFARPVRLYAARQRGVATLVVVAVLFFIVSLVAAYTNRNLIFEQRTSGNQYRSTQAFEAAEAGMEWALAMLNGGRVAADCTPTADPTVASFRQRYLDIDGSTGAVVPVNKVATGEWASCVHDGTNWTCNCPDPNDAGPAVLAAPVGVDVFPAFRIRFLPIPAPASRPGAVRLQVNGCTRLDDDCLNFPAPPAIRPLGAAGEGHASIETLIALKSALPSPPTAAVTVRGSFDLEGASFGAFNPSPGSSGIALLAGDALSNDGSLRFGSAPGTPADRADLVRSLDSALAAAAVPNGDRLFGAVFATSPDNYRDQPAALLLNCAALACDADRLRAVASRHPGRVIWAEGDVTMNGGAALGTPDDPVVLVVNGDLALDNITVNGLVYGRPGPGWTVTGSGSMVRGALLAENNLAGGAEFDVVHDAGVLALLRWRHGSFVRVPGSWRDF